MEVAQVVSGNSCFEDQVQRADIVPSRDVVEQVLGVLQNLWPQLGRHSLGPPELGVKHHGSGQAEHHSNLSFSNSILVVGSNSTEGQPLAKLGEFILELSSSEDSVVCVVVEDNNTHGVHFSFKGPFGTDCLTSSEVDNWFHMNIATGMVLEDDSTFEHP